MRVFLATYVCVKVAALCAREVHGHNGVSAYRNELQLVRVDVIKTALPAESAPNTTALR